MSEQLALVHWWEGWANLVGKGGREAVGRDGATQQHSLQLTALLHGPSTAAGDCGAPLQQPHGLVSQAAGEGGCRAQLPQGPPLQAGAVALGGSSLCHGRFSTQWRADPPTLCAPCTWPPPFLCCSDRIKSEFPEILPIKESLIK